jgi:hypothetical protein
MRTRSEPPSCSNYPHHSGMHSLTTAWTSPRQTSRFPGEPARGSRLAIMAVAAVVFTGCSPRDSSLAQQLARRSTEEGLAIVYQRSHAVGVIPFSGTERFLESECLWGMPAVFDTTGEAVARYKPIPNGCEFVVERIDGGTIATPRPPGAFVPSSLNAKARRLTFWGDWPGKARTVGQRQSQYWASFDFMQGGLLDACTGQYSCTDWSPDGHMIVYEQEGQIRVLDTDAGASRILGQGHDPTWSPNGKWLAFRTPSGHPNFITTDGAPVHSQIEGHEILDAIRWSPDGGFVFFAERIRFGLPILMPDYALVACRISDGRTTILRRFGGGIPGSGVMQFSWIKHSQEFCHECRQGREFN